MLKVGDFDLIIKGLTDLSRDEITDKTSLRAMFLFNS
jgi:hypothetical protein